MKTYQELLRLQEILSREILPTSDREWGGADVVITKTKPPKSTGEQFYPDPRYVVTEFSFELSWLFKQLFEAFISENRINGASKIEFFGRLANSANRYLSKTENIKPNLLLAAVLHEAFAVYEEMEDGDFSYLMVAFGNEILDDYIDQALKTGFVGTDQTIEFFKNRGIALIDD